jgi:hypothetical protein
MQRIFGCIIVLHFCFMMNGQQNSTLFLMHATPQANFVNPAVRNYCTWMLGLPVISSFHVEYGNPSFTFKALKKQSNNTFLLDGNQILNKLGRINYLTTELHTNLFFLSFWRKDNFFTFSINEKADLFLTYPRDLMAIGVKGNTQFEGQTADLNHVGVFLNYRREYAIGMARRSSDDFVWGIRGKWLFGKMNTSTVQSQNSLYTAPATFDLDLNVLWRLNTTLPIRVETSPDDSVIAIHSDVKIGKILLERHNVGLAFDLGFIHYHNDDVTIAGSILDIGAIRWSSNGYSFTDNGHYVYQGPLTDTVTANYFNQLKSAFKDKLQIRATHKSYVSFLNPMVYMGVTYKLKDDLDVGGLVSGRINRYRITSGLTLSVNKDFNRSTAVSLSWSYIYKSIKNVGAGIKLGTSPLQFYAVSDNIFGLIKPLDTNNINLRFGLQFSFGCSEEKLSKVCGCGWVDEENNRRERIKRMKRMKK